MTAPSPAHTGDGVTPRATCTSWPVSVFMAGDIACAIQACRSYCDEIGLCVTVTPTTYVYTGGEEAGFVVGLINYARFPSEPADIEAKALGLAWLLHAALKQGSFTVQTPTESRFYSTREND